MTAWRECSRVKSTWCLLAPVRRVCASVCARACWMCSHVILPKEMVKTLPKTRLLTETEWRSLGVQQSRGWEHYAWHK